MWTFSILSLSSSINTISQIIEVARKAPQIKKLQLVSLELRKGWIELELDWIGLNWIELNYNWIELDWIGQPYPF